MIWSAFRQPRLHCVMSHCGQWDFDSRAVIGFQLGTVSVLYPLVTHSLRTWLLVTSAGMTEQGRRYPLETQGLFWHRVLSVMASIHRLFMKGFTWKLQRLIGPWRSSLLLVLHGFRWPWPPYECLITTGLHTWLNKVRFSLLLKSCLPFLISPLLSLLLSLWCLGLYKSFRITLLIHMDFTFNYPHTLLERSTPIIKSLHWRLERSGPVIQCKHSSAIMDSP